MQVAMSIIECGTARLTLRGLSITRQYREAFYSVYRHITDVKAVQVMVRDIEEKAYEGAGVSLNSFKGICKNNTVKARMLNDSQFQIETFRKKETELLTLITMLLKEKNNE